MTTPSIADLKQKEANCQMLLFEEFKKFTESVNIFPGSGYWNSFNLMKRIQKGEPLDQQMSCCQEFWRRGILINEKDTVYVSDGHINTYVRPK